MRSRHFAGHDCRRRQGWGQQRRWFLMRSCSFSLRMNYIFADFFHDIASLIVVVFRRPFMPVCLWHPPIAFLCFHSNRSIPPPFPVPLFRSSICLSAILQFTCSFHFFIRPFSSLPFLALHLFEQSSSPSLRLANCISHRIFLPSNWTVLLSLCLSVCLSLSLFPFFLEFGHSTSSS